MKKGNWIVTLKCVVKKTVCVNDRTEEEATKMPWSNSTDEQEVDMEDWEVLKVEPNE
jgi:hypothetical protein